MFKHTFIFFIFIINIITIIIIVIINIEILMTLNVYV